jgi:hypothetical protein
MKYQHKYFFKSLLAIAALVALASSPASSAQNAPSLGAASTFAVLGSTNVTCTASPIGVISGDVGVAPGVFTNSGCTVVGTVHQNDSAASNAQTAFQNAYQNAQTDACTGSLLPAYTATTLTLMPGVYCPAAALTFTDTKLTLDAQNNANAVWIFKIPAALSGSGLQVVMANGAQPCNVFWVVGAATTLSTSSLPPLFQGNILAGSGTGSVTITGGAVIGRVLANVAVTLTNTNIHGSCAIAAQGGGGKGCDLDDNEGHHHDNDKDKDRDHEKDDDKGHGDRSHDQ